MATKKDVARCLVVLRAALPRQTITGTQFEQMTTTWTTLLEDIPANLLEMATRAYCATSTPFFPSAGQIRHLALDMVEDHSQRITAGDAWAEVQRALANGQHAHEWSNPLVRKAFEAVGGWTYFHGALLSSVPADRARFMQAFDTYQQREQADRRMLPAVREFVSQRRELEGDVPQELGEPPEFRALVEKLRV